MRYPLKLTTISPNLRIYTPDYEQVKETYEKLIEANPGEIFPYWAKHWPSSTALVRFIHSKLNIVKDKTVIEIGAGLGLPSLSIAGFAKSIEVTDYAPEAVELLKKNIQHLQFNNVKARQLDWNNCSKTIYAEVLLLSDVNYHPGEFDGLIKLINGCIDKGVIILLATPQRIMASSFVQALQQFIKESHVEKMIENGKSVEISILVLSK